MRYSGFMGLFLLLLLAWGVAYFAYHVVNPTIHLLLVFAVISLALHFLWDPKKNEKNDLSRPS